jgi:hypothetical protein
VKTIIFASVVFTIAAQAEIPETYRKLWSDPAVAGRIERDIEQHRKGDATIEVIGQDGKPLANVTVEVRQRTHEFLFGCNLFVLDQLATPELNAKYERAFINLFNFATRLASSPAGPVVEVVQGSWHHAQGPRAHLREECLHA